MSSWVLSVKINLCGDAPALKGLLLCWDLSVKNQAVDSTN